MNMRRLSKAFTMLEILVVVALIGVIMAFVAPRIMKYMNQAGKAEIKFKCAGIKEGLNEYRLEFGMFPTTREGLRALVENPRPNDDRFKRSADKWPFVKPDTITDKAGNEFTYHCPAEKFKNKYRYFEILYLGPTQSEDDPEFFDL